MTSPEFESEQPAKVDGQEAGEPTVAPEGASDVTDVADTSNDQVSTPTEVSDAEVDANDTQTNNEKTND